MEQALVDGELIRADIVVEDDLIADVVIEPSADEVGDDDADCVGLVIAPGFIDVQCNGAGGVDITSEPDRILDVAAELPRFGVTSFLPTVVTAPASTRAAAIAAMTAIAEKSEHEVDGQRAATPPAFTSRVR